MKKIITKHQKTDMGSGFGVYEFEKKDTLLDFLQWHKNTGDTWDVISIFNKNNGTHITHEYRLRKVSYFVVKIYACSASISSSCFFFKL